MLKINDIVIPNVSRVVYQCKVDYDGQYYGYCGFYSDGEWYCFDPFIPMTEIYVDEEENSYVFYEVTHRNFETLSDYEHYQRLLRKILDND